jgi:hypothetical protein
VTEGTGVADGRIVAVGEAVLVARGVALFSLPASSRPSLSSLSSLSTVASFVSLCAAVDAAGVSVIGSVTATATTVARSPLGVSWQPVATTVRKIIRRNIVGGKRETFARCISKIL